MDSELEERKKDNNKNSEMTVSILRKSPSPNRGDFPSVIMTQQSTDSIPSTLERMKLESYIEKIITESPQSSESTEDEPSSGQSFDNNKNPFDFNQSTNKSTFDNNNESIKNWLQRITTMQNEINRKIVSNQQSSTSTSTSTTSSNVFRSSNECEKTIRYQDLPYMGEMTLDNSKPRRGRKPKKADICHLIYKNYGTIFPGTPESKNPIDRDGKKKSTDHNNKTDVQSKIINSLLEKRLTQQFTSSNCRKSWEKSSSSTSTSTTTTTTKSSLSSRKIQSAEEEVEPLNLCIKDMNQLKIRLQNHNNKNKHQNLTRLKEEPSSFSDDESESTLDTIPSPSCSSRLDTGDNNGETATSSSSSNYIYWPSNGGIFVHPMTLQQHLMYYQRMANGSNNFNLPSHSPRPPPEGSPISEKSSSSTSLRKIRPKKNEVDDVESSIDQKSKRILGTTTNDKTPTKRKRSAIFIPPIPSENQNNPATEVSIGKFKFTGGAKPSLQEKKMLSVDSGGNFRYYSGTGDKSMRGYEFFPRETLQQQIVQAQGSSTGAFLHASGEKIFPAISEKSPNEFFITNDATSSSIVSPTGDGGTHRLKKRKSRKSLQREKLEQTFKEKGFLIQTQQLESAEGATYCKFRQLRKFTRYLFRSWKDYLPGNVRELQEGEEEESMENDLEEFENFQKTNGIVSDDNSIN